MDCRSKGVDKLQRAKAKGMKGSEREDLVMSKQYPGTWLSLISMIGTVVYLPYMHKVGHHGVEGPDIRQTICASRVSIAQYPTVRAAYRLIGAPLLSFRATKY